MARRRYAFNQDSTGPCGGTFYNKPGSFNYSQALAETARLMVSEGYKDAGYRVVGPSDGSAMLHAEGRGPGGEYRLDPGPWPGGVAQVQAFSDWLHDEMGLQFGWCAVPPPPPPNPQTRAPGHAAAAGTPLVATRPAAGGSPRAATRSKTPRRSRGGASIFCSTTRAAPAAPTRTTRRWSCTAAWRGR